MLLNMHKCFRSLRLEETVYSNLILPEGMLAAGLGDIAVPGLLACLALRFDLSKLLSITAAGQASSDVESDMKVTLK